jgi:serine protease Do
MRKISCFFICVVVSVYLTSCATILNSQNQKVAISTKQPKSKVYVNDQYVGEGSMVIAPMKRDLTIKQIKVDSEGYKSEYKVHFQDRKSPLHILSWVPFGILLYPPLYDYGPKAFDYQKQTTVTPSVKVAKRNPDEKYIYLKSTAFNVKKENLAFEKHNNYKKYYAGNSNPKVKYGEKDLEIDNSIFTASINNVLKKNGFVDTTKTIFKSNTNSLYISAEINKLTFKDVYVTKSSYRINFASAEGSIDWEILDIYGQTKLSKTIVCNSGDFSSNFYNKNDEYIAAIIEDLVNTSFFKLMQTSEVKKLLKQEKNIEPTYEKLAILKPTLAVKQLSMATNATVTITNKGSHGSGCIISKDGYIVTNYHVIAGNNPLEVILNDGRKLPCKFIRGHEESDLALLKVEMDFPTSYLLPAIGKYSVGDDVFAIGTPNSVELGQTLSKGIVSGVRKKEKMEWIQTDVSVNPGNSGGALVNKNGELIGIVNSKLVGFGVEGIAFCIPAQQVFEMLRLAYK